MNKDYLIAILWKGKKKYLSQPMPNRRKENGQIRTWITWLWFETPFNRMMQRFPSKAEAESYLTIRKKEEPRTFRDAHVVEMSWRVSK